MPRIELTDDVSIARTDPAGVAPYQVFSLQRNRVDPWPPQKGNAKNKILSVRERDSDSYV